jgi:hypothetical protein
MNVQDLKNYVEVQVPYNKYVMNILPRGILYERNFTTTKT